MGGPDLYFDDLLTGTEISEDPLDPAPYPMSVYKLADLCKKFLPGLTYLHLSKINVYYTDGFQIQFGEGGGDVFTLPVGKAGGWWGRRFGEACLEY